MTELDCDILMVNEIGPAFTGESVRTAGIGGSELEITQIAEVLAARGHKVIVANGVHAPSEDHGVRYVPFHSAGGLRTRALYVERGTTLARIAEPVLAQRIVIRATDIMCEHYEPHRSKLERGDATLVCVSNWQLDGFKRAMQLHAPRVIAPMLGPTPPTERVKGRFIYASAPAKGLDATLAKWTELRGWSLSMRACHLLVAIPGFAMGDAPPTWPDGVEFVGAPTIEEYRRLIASAEGLFYVNTMAETFGNVVALAERSGTRAHVLCLDGLGGMREASSDRRITTDARAFEVGEAGVLSELGLPARLHDVPDRSPEALAPAWEDALGLGVERMVPRGLPAAQSDEQRIPQEPPCNPDPVPYFGGFLSLLRSSVAVGGSELGLGMTLFSLAVSIRAAVVVEIGRFRGFSTLALAGACEWNAIGWDEPKAAQQRPDVDYTKFHAPKRRSVVSIDKHPDAAAHDLIERAGLLEHVHFVDQASEDVTLKGEPIDLLFIDGDHSYEGLKRDVARFVPQVRAGGYVVLHDYFGWYDAAGKNGSAVARVVAELDAMKVERLLVDTGYASLVVFRKKAMEGLKAPAAAAARADGKPTVGLCLLAKNENPIVARALSSCRAWIDAVTVLVDEDTTDGTAELCERLGAEVHVRPYAGSLAATRNELLAIAEMRTDYVLMVDADDCIEGDRPAELTADVYDVMVHDAAARYPRGQLIKSRIGARYVGCDRGCAGNIPHEYLDRPGAKYGGICPTLVYRRMGGVQGISGWQDQAGSKAKYLRHARDLLRHHVDHPDHARTVFYLAQSFRDAGEPRTARDWYRRRLAMSQDEEAWFSAIRVAETTQELGEDPVSAYLDAYASRPFRAESLLGLAAWYRDDKRKHYAIAYLYAQQASGLPMPESERMFLAPDIYLWGAKSEHAICAHLMGKHDEAAQLMERVLGAVPADRQPWAREVLARFVAARGR